MVSLGKQLFRLRLQSSNEVAGVRHSRGVVPGLGFDDLFPLQRADLRPNSGLHLSHWEYRLNGQIEGFAVPTPAPAQMARLSCHEDGFSRSALQSTLTDQPASSDSCAVLEPGYQFDSPVDGVVLSMHGWSPPSASPWVMVAVPLLFVIAGMLPCRLTRLDDLVRGHCTTASR